MTRVYPGKPVQLDLQLDEFASNNINCINRFFKGQFTMATTDKKIVSAKPAKTAAPAVVRAKVTPAPVAPAPMAKVAPKRSAKPIAMPKTEKPAKVKKPKLVRDSFTIPQG